MKTYKKTNITQKKPPSLKVNFKYQLFFFKQILCDYLFIEHTVKIFIGI